ncbi:MAG TPA: hypothetical protein VF842_03355, partial [Flavobacterium sp.]
VENDETLSYMGTSLKASNVYFISDVLTKTKGKTTAIAPATSGVSANASTVVASESTTATGAGNGVGAPTWTSGWAVGL